MIEQFKFLIRFQVLNEKNCVYARFYIYALGVAGISTSYLSQFTSLTDADLKTVKSLRALKI